MSFHSADGNSILVVHDDGRNTLVGMMPLKEKQKDPGAKGLFMVLRAAVEDAGNLVRCRTSRLSLLVCSCKLVSLLALFRSLPEVLGNRLRL